MQSFNKTQNRFDITLALIIIIGISSCNKKVEVFLESDNDRTFLYTYGPGGQWNTCIMGSEDGYVLVGNYRDISKVGYDGSIIWQTNDSNRINYTYRNNGIRLKDGSYLINSYSNSSEITLINEYGELMYSKQLTPSLFTRNSRILEGGSGKAYVSYTNVNISGPSSAGQIITFDSKSGNPITDYSYRGNLFSPSKEKPDQFYIYRATESNYWVIGDDNMLLKDTSGVYKRFNKTFIMKLSPANDAIEKTVILSEQELFTEELCDYMATRNNKLVAITAANNPMATNELDLNTYFDVRLIDEELNEVWKTNVQLPAQKLSPRRMCEALNGDIIIIGSCVLQNSKYTTSFVARLNSSGSLLHYKIFEEFRNFYLTDVIQDGNYFVFSGSSNGFGNSNEGEKRIILKTDSDFNF